MAFQGREVTRRRWGAYLGHLGKGGHQLPGRSPAASPRLCPGDRDWGWWCCSPHEVQEPGWGNLLV